MDYWLFLPLLPNGYLGLGLRVALTQFQRLRYRSGLIFDSPKSYVFVVPRAENLPQDWNLGLCGNEECTRLRGTLSR